MKSACLAALSLLVGACSSSDSIPVIDYRIDGVVTDAASGAGISSAQVHFTSDTLYMAQTTTDGDGNFKLDVKSDVPFGQVHVDKDGYRSADVTVYFDSSPRTLSIAMQKL